MSDDPTEALKAYLESKPLVCQEVQNILNLQRTDQEACDALRTYLLSQMYGSLRQQNPMLAAVEEARQARDINWWWLLYELGWEPREKVEDIPW